jgi:hypothetical protein
MVGRPTRDGGFSPVKAQLAKIKLLDESIDYADGIVFGNIVPPDTQETMCLGCGYCPE